MTHHLRQQYLDAIGIQNWQLKSAADNDKFTSLEDEVLVNNVQPQLPSQEPQPFSEEPQLSSQEPQPILQEPQPSLQKPQSLLPEPLSFSIEPQQPATSETVKNIQEILPQIDQTDKENPLLVSEPDSELNQSIKNCQQCPGRQTRINALSGQGNRNAAVFVISEAPNAEEDRSGHYLTEQPLSLFHSMLHSINSDSNCFFTGIIKCHSLSDYGLSEDDVGHCAAFLHAQIAQTKPSVLLVLGAAQAQVMLHSKQSFNELRGKVHQTTINDTQYPLIVSYHPAYLIRNPIYKRQALKDLIMLKKLIK